MTNDANPGREDERRTILIVEDHDGVRKLLRTWLLHAFPEDRVLDVASGEEALILADTEPPDLVLMDIQLPRMDGIEATRRVKAVAPQTRVVMLTSLDDAGLRLAASAAGASAYVAKHAMHTELLPAIEAVHAPSAITGHPTGHADPGADRRSKTDSGSRE